MPFTECPWFARMWVSVMVYRPLLSFSTMVLSSSTVKSVFSNSVLRSHQPSESRVRFAFSGACRSRYERKTLLDFSLMLFRHWCPNWARMPVVHQLDRVHRELIDVLDGWIELQRWRWEDWVVCLLAYLIHVVLVHMRITKDQSKFVNSVTADLRNHVRQQRVRGDVEWNAKKQISRTLVHLAAQFIVRVH